MIGETEFDWERVLWWVFGAVLAAVLGYVLYDFLGTIVFGLFIYYATRPVYHRIQDRIGSRSVSAAVALVTLAVPFVLLLAYTTAVAVAELSALLVSLDAGQYESLLGPYMDVSELVTDPQDLLSNPDIQEYIGIAIENAGIYLGLLGTVFLHLLVVLTLSYYLLKDDHRLSGWILETFGDERGVLETYSREVDRDFQIVFFGNILNAFITGIVGALVFNALNVWAPVGLAVPSPTLVGVLCGAASLIPVVGMKLVYVPVGGYLLARAVTTAPGDSVWFPITVLAVAAVMVDFIPDMIIRPYVSGRNLHLGTVILAYILGPLVFGWYGLFLGPMLLIVTVHFVREVLPVLIEDAPYPPSRTGSTAAEPSVGDETEREAAGPVADDVVFESADRDEESDRSGESGHAVAATRAADTDEDPANADGEAGDESAAVDLDDSHQTDDANPPDDARSTDDG